MADNATLKLVVAGVVGAVIGAAVVSQHYTADAFRHGFASGSWAYRPWAAGDDWDYPPQWRQRPKVHTTCWQQFEAWDFGTVRRPVPCEPRRRAPERATAPPPSSTTPSKPDLIPVGKASLGGSAAPLSRHDAVASDVDAAGREAAVGLPGRRSDVDGGARF